MLVTNHAMEAYPFLFAISVCSIQATWLVEIICRVRVRVRVRVRTRLATKVAGENFGALLGVTY